MSTIRFFYPMFILVMFSACGPKQAKVMEDKSENQPIEEVTKEMEIEEDIPIEKPAFVNAGIKRTPCYGACKVYEAHFDARGYATYKGKSNVKMMGNWKASLTADQCSDILTMAQKADYFNLPDIYPANGKIIPDLPYTITYVEFGNQKKEIKNNHDAPQELVDFEAFLDELILKLEWQKTDGQ